MADKNQYQEKYGEYLAEVEKILADYRKDSQPACMYEPFNYILTGGGKRIRPVLSIISAAACGANPNDAFNTAAAIEILHNFTLVHDDIMDDSPMRRGRVTVHEKWDPPTAILLGDVMVGHAYALLPDCSQHSRAGEINRAFTQGLIEVCEGQAYDMDFNLHKDITPDDYLMMIEMKTSRLLECSAVIGAHIAEADEKLIGAARMYARELGIGFQIQDDLLDITADQAQLGKTVGLDIAEGKKTFLIIAAKEVATEKNDIELLDKFFENDGLPLEYVPQMKEMFSRLGIFNKARRAAGKRFDNARQYVREFPPGFHTDMLLWLVDKIDKRNY
jgi:geranylgeranyl diphosphate synthase type II